MTNKHDDPSSGIQTVEGDEQNLNYLRLYLHHCSSSLSNFKSKLYLKTCPQHLLQSAHLFVHRSRKRPPPPPPSALPITHTHTSSTPRQNMSDGVI